MWINKYSIEVFTICYYVFSMYKWYIIVNKLIYDIYKYIILLFLIFVLPVTAGSII